jgi:hypothetical protein
MNFLVWSFFLVFSSVALSNTDLIGAWSNCDEGNKGLHFEHFIQFQANGIEGEFHLLRLRSAVPCEGPIISVVGRKWNYEVQGDSFKSVLSQTDALALNEKIIQEFNRMKMCNSTKWEKNVWIDCTKNFFYGFEEKKGYTVVHAYKRKGNELLVKYKEVGTTKYKRINSLKTKSVP